MSYESLSDDDLSLKLRLMNLLWNLGWFVRPNVKLYRYQEGKRTTATFTDIDILGIRLLPLQNPITAVCSAKSGKESDSAQIFWLAGVKSYFGASFAYYVRTKASLVTAKSLCQKLEIIPLNEEQLRSMEERFSIRPETIASQFDMELYKRTHEIFADVKEKKVALFNYVTERYWIDPPNSQLLRLITALKDVNELLLSSQIKLFVKYYLSALFAIPLFRLVQSLVTVPTNLVRSELETALMGGELARSDREKIIGTVKSYMREFFRNSGFTESRVEKGVDFDSDFKRLTGDLYDLVVSLVEHYNQAIYVPRMMDALTIQLAKSQDLIPSIEKVSLPDLSQADWKYAAKLTKDLLIFVQRIGVLSKSEIAR